ncbi:MAG: pantetheine-phosphate adenylyltransferase [Candidatus Brocadiia bacterium]|nr:pantetheine-phosphate adenylyltransferase [Planctomycetota bacterium]
MNDKTVCVYAGSFDPPTNGHMFMIEKGTQLFDSLIVSIGINPNKNYTFSVDERVEMLRECTEQYTSVSIDHFENLFLVDYAESVGADYILRGIRSQQDYEFERAMRNINEDINSSITTIFMMPPREICEVSSSFVKGLMGPEGWEDIVRPYVPDAVYKQLLKTPVRWHKQTGGPETASD